MKIKIIGIFVCMLLIGTTLTVSVTVDLESNSLPQLFSTTLYVGGSGPGNYSKIQDAINDSTHGDKVYVYSGVYYEELIINTSISLIGEDKYTTIIKLNKSYFGGDHNIISIFASSVTVNGFCIQNGYNGVQINEHPLPKTSHENNISGNIFKGCGGRAIELYSNNNTISDNIDNSTRNGGIDIDGYDNIISRNTISNLNWYGIRIRRHSMRTIVSNNNISNCVEGIQLLGCNENIISHNILRDNSYGLTFYNCPYENIVTDNCFFNDGFFVSEDTIGNTISNNTVSGKKILYVENESDIVIEEDVGQLIIVHCKNVTVKDFNISNVSVGIQLIMSDYCKVTKNRLTDNLYGIFIHGSFNNEVSENDISNSMYSGITLKSCFGSIISRNNLEKNNLHIYPDYEYFFMFGVNSSASIFLTGSFNNTIIENMINNNNHNGISLILSGKNKLLDNTIESNKDIGVLIAGSILNNIKENNFFNNKEDAYFHTSFLNKWNDNYWSQSRKTPKIIPGNIGRRIKWFNVDWKPANEPNILLWED